MDYRPLQLIIYERLLEMIRNHEMAFDTIYSETRIAKEFAVSRTPMRDALNRLAGERYIDILPSRGFCLHKSTREDVLEAYRMRSALEGYCARELAAHSGEDNAQECISRMQEMNEMQARMSQEQNMDLRAYWDYDYEFHSLMIRFVDAPAFLQQFNSFMHFFMAHYVKNYCALSREQSTVVEHGALIDALRAGDANAAARAIQFHLDQTLAITLQSIED